MIARQQALVALTTNPQSASPLSGGGNMPVARIGTPWQGAVWGIGGNGGYGYSVVSKPSWMSASVVGPYLLFSGTSTAVGNASVYVDITDGTPTTQRVSFTVTTTSAITGAGGVVSVQPAYTGIPYSLDLTTFLSNPVLPLTSSSVTTGTLPTGMTLHSSTAIIDATTVSGTTQDVVVTITDGAGNVAVLPLHIQVKPRLAFGTISLPVATVGVDYLYQVPVTGGSGQYSLSLDSTSDSLVAGHEISSRACQIVGRATAPTAAAVPQSIKFTVTDLVTGDAVSSGRRPLAVAATMAPATPGTFVVAGADGTQTSTDSLAAFFGGGADGDLTFDGSSNPSIAPLTGGYNTPQRDLYARNLTITATGKLNTNGARFIYVSGVLDISAAVAGSIVDRLTPAVPTPGHYSTIGGNSGAGATGNGVAGSSAPAPKFSIGKSGGQGGSGGHGSGTNVGGNGAAVTSPSIGTVRPIAFHDAMVGLDIQPSTPSSSATAPVFAGIGGGGGGGGGGNGTNAGGAGSAGAAGGSYICIFAHTINRGASTGAGVISVAGGLGSNGANASGGTTQGGGGGAGGGSGGLIRIYYAQLTGAQATGALDATGGKGGDGGARTGTTPATVGSGASGGAGGLIVVGDLLQGITTITDGAAGSAASGQTGGAGGACVANL
jgi:hypothetical protein